MNKLNSKKSLVDSTFDIVNYSILGIVLLTVIYPLYFIAIASISEPNLVNSGQVWIIPKGIMFEGYERVFSDPNIMTGYRNSIFYTVFGTVINVTLTLMAGYSLSRKDLKGKNAIMLFMTFTMFFSGGLIPTYLVVKSLGMINNIWAMLIPNAVGVWNIIIARTFFQTSIPDELLEAAIIDGCTNTKFYVKIALPLSKALIAIMILFYGVGHWNAFFNALIYLRDKKLFPLQLVLRGILVDSQMLAEMVKDQDMLSEYQRLTEVIKYALIIVASLPLLIVYPFVQKYFVKGIMIGSLKG